MHRLKRKEAALKSKCRGEMGPAPREDRALQLALGAQEGKAGTGTWTPNQDPHRGLSYAREA